MEGRQLRGRDAIALDLVGVVGLSAFLLGLVWLQDTDKLGFDAADALTGVISQLSVTLPAALLVLAATALELAAGLVLARAARTRPFDSVAEALVAAMVAAVLKDTLLLGSLGAVGLFKAPVLIGIDVLILLAAWGIKPVARRVQPLVAFGGWRGAAGSIGSVPLAALVAIVWAGPVILQLSSPVVPFIDVLPNYVGPVEHLRTFGWFSPLSATQSPIIGPSRTVLGYDGLLGALAAMTNLSGGFAIAAFILPQAVLVGAAIHRLARALSGRDPGAGPWILLAFALTQPFARLADARGTVVVVPLVCLGLALAAECLGRASKASDAAADLGDATGAADAADAADPATSAPAEDAESPWRTGRGAFMGLALGAAILVHPVIGFFGVATVGLVALIRPRQLAVDATVGLITSGLIAVPQLATMLGLSLPTISVAIALVVAVVLGFGAGRLFEGRVQLREGIVRVAEAGRWVLLVFGALALIPIVAASILNLDRLPDAVESAAELALASCGILLATLAVGIVLGSRAARSPIVLVGIAVGAAAVLLTQLLPSDLGFLGDALRFEVPKTVYYWLSMIVAAGAGPVLAMLWARTSLPFVGRVAALAVFVIAAALPLRAKPIDAYHLGEHRWSETFAIDLRWAGSGFWVGFPDSRTVVDEPRQEILDAVRAEIEAGRLAHDTPVLHVADSFQQWASTPLGVFDGVNETSVSNEPEVSHQTVGGRLYGFDDLPGFLASGTYPYVVLEPNGVPDGTRDQIIAAGYRSIFANDQGEVFVAGT